MSKYIPKHSISIGFNPDNEQDFFDVLSMYEDYVYDYFFDIDRSLVGNHYDRNSVLELLSNCNTYDIPANLVCNTHMEPENYIEKIQAVKDIINLNSITVLNPEISNWIKSKYPELKVHLSVRFWDWGRFKNPIARVKELKDMGVDVINVSGAYSYNDFELMNYIHELGMKLKFIVNEGCVIRKDFNYSQFPEFTDNMCRTNPFSIHACKSDCVPVRRKYPWMTLTNNNIYKESLKYYNIDIYKISTRHRSIKDVIELLSYWTSDDDTSIINQQFFSALDISKHYDTFLEYINERSKCSGYCVNCQKCKKFWDIFTEDLSQEEINKRFLFL